MSTVIDPAGDSATSRLAGSSGKAGALRARLVQWFAITLMFPLLVYLCQLILLCLRFGELPNYFKIHDWLHNVHVIIRSTPSLRDVFEIGADEWLFEIGRIDDVYGLRVAVWSLAILPAKWLSLLIAGALATTSLALLRTHSPPRCDRRLRLAGSTFTVAGTTLTGLTAVTISWVACCGVPSWITGLTILGLNYSAALFLKPYGFFISAAGFAFLIAGIVLLDRARKSTEAVRGGDGSAAEGRTPHR